MDDRLRRIIEKISNEKLRSNVLELIKNPSIKVGKETYKGLPFELAPAGLVRHHSYPSGLLEHVISSAKIALAFCECVEDIYHGKVDRDLVISGVLLHDLYKTLIYEEWDGRYRVTSLAERVDHLSLIVSEMVRRGFPLDLIHIVGAHHGEAGAIKPRTVEALVCHLADLADSQLNGEVMRAARYLIRNVTGRSLRLTSKEAFDIVYSKAAGGWESLRDTVDKMLEEA
ncbi:MAG: HDIG domain-containing protein [Candidatus Bathyarchaeota archaeon]|nr:HDIG domain-containing protein [Candidatus Bathyarchaeota archaeon]